MNANDTPPLTLKQRLHVLRQTFDAITAIGFMKWKAEELALGYEVSEEDRKAYFGHFKQSNFGEFTRMTGTAADERLLDARDYWIDQADKMGIKEWQQVLSKGEGAKPWYNAIRHEIEDQNSRRRTAEPSPQQEQSKDDSRGR